MARGMTIKVNKKTGNVVCEMHGYEGQTCIPKAEQVIEKLKALGIKVDIDTFHLKSEECGVLQHIAEKAESKE